MTPTRWLIVAFWTVMIMVAGAYVIQVVLAPPPPKIPERHWFPPPLPSSTPVPSADADVRMTHYVMTLVPNASVFTVNVTVQNLGQKKATGVQLQIQPYVGTMSTTPGQNGPDEIPAQAGGDPMANVTQWVSFPDLDPGQSSTQVVTLPIRGDADPAQSQLKPQAEFQTVP